MREYSRILFEVLISCYLVVIAETDKFETVEGNVYFPPGNVLR